MSENILKEDKKKLIEVLKKAKERFEAIRDIDRLKGLDDWIKDIEKVIKEHGYE